MEDIADAPDYLGVIAIILMLVVLSGISYWAVLQKFVFVGEYAGLVSGFLGVVLSGALVVAGFLFVGVWLVESLIVKHGCDSGSGWSFKTAASVAGYAWVISVAGILVSLPVSYFLLPTFTIDTSGLPYSMPSFEGLGELRLYRWLFSLPVSLLFLAWTAYVGAKGVNYGTDGQCSFSKGFAVFFVLGFLGLLPSLLV